MTEEKRELYTEKLTAGSRTYFFDVKESKDGNKYLVISESRHSEPNHPHSRVMVFEEHLEAFSEAYEKTVHFLRIRAKAYSVDDLRRKHPKAYQKWTPDEDKRLKEGFNASVSKLAKLFQRQEGAIRSRLTKLGIPPQENKTL